MKVIVLGSWAAYPKANEACSGYLLTIENKNILLDCGSGVLSSLANYISFEDLDAVVLSHYHADHMSDIYSLQYASDLLMKRGIRKEPLKIYGHNKNAVFNTLSYKESSIAIPINENEEQIICNAKFSFLKTKHQEICYAIRIDTKDNSIVYTGDTGWIDSLIGFAHHTDLLICEASLFNDQKGLNEGHLTAGEAGKIALFAGAKNLLLTHFPHTGDLLELQKQAENECKDTNVLMASKGMVIN